jgi:uncharacterized protein YodC (DUF2158 family)
MAINKFNIGDTVRLNSGSPKLTVREFVNEAKDVKCSWFNVGQVSTSIFPMECLRKDDQPEDFQ